jgi:hypothetical protein
LAAIEREERDSEGEFFIRVCGIPVLGFPRLNLRSANTARAWVQPFFG